MPTRVFRAQANGFWRAGSICMDVELYAGEDPSRFACSKLTGAPFYDRGRSKSGDRPAGAALERLARLHRAGGRLLVHSKVKKTKSLIYSWSAAAGPWQLSERQNGAPVSLEQANRLGSSPAPRYGSILSIPHDKTHMCTPLEGGRPSCAPFVTPRHWRGLATNELTTLNPRCEHIGTRCCTR